MSRIKSYTIHMEPFYSGRDKMVEVSTVVNGRNLCSRTVLLDTLPHEAEMEALHRIGLQMIDKLKREERHEHCCCHKNHCCCC